MSVVLSKRKKNLILTLITASFILLLINLALDLIPGKEVKVKHAIFKDGIGERINKLFDAYALEDGWIKKTPVKPSGKDSLTFVYNVTLPADIIITDVLKTLNTFFPEKEIEVISRERKIEMFTSTFIYVDDILFTQINFKKNNSLSRKSAKISFVVENFESLGDEEKKRLLAMPISFSVLIKPADENLEWVKNILTSNKDYLILLDDTIDDGKYELADKLSRIRLKSSVISIIADFGKNKMIFIDTRSKLYKSIVYNFIKDEFARKGYRMYSQNKYKSLSASSVKETISKFKFYEESLKGKKRGVFRIDARQLLNIKESIGRYLMRGNKIIPFIQRD